MPNEQVEQPVNPPVEAPGQSNWLEKASEELMKALEVQRAERGISHEKLPGEKGEETDPTKRAVREAMAEARKAALEQTRRRLGLPFIELTEKEPTEKQTDGQTEKQKPEEIAELKELRKKTAVEVEGAQEIAHIITSRGDFGNDHQHKRIAGIFKDAIDLGPESIRKLVMNINTELKEQGKDVELWANLKVLPVRFVHDREEQKLPPLVKLAEVQVVRLDLKSPKGYIDDQMYAESVPQPYTETGWRRLLPEQKAGN